MKLIVNYNPAIGTFNLGDEIISDSIFNEMHQIYQNAFQVNISTHYEIPKCFADAVSKSKYKFVLGTNLLRNNISDFWPIYTELGPMILIGCCWKPEEVKTSDNGAEMYKSVLSKEYIYSVRDSYTEKRLKDIGLLNVINTGCPTIWKFNQSFCNLIPRKKLIL